MRTFKETWISQYLWMKREMKLSIYTKCENTGSFVTAFTNMRIEALKRHSISLGHGDNVQKDRLCMPTRLQN